MNDFNIRITRRVEFGDRSHEEAIDIDFGKAGQPILLVEGEMTGAAVTAATGLPTMQLRPQLEWSATLCNGERVKFAAAEKACAALGEGWRLPTRAELLSLVDDTRSDPAIDTERFPDTKSAAYWTGTPLASDSSYAWIVDFDYGLASNCPRGSGSGAFVRAVRSVPAGQ